MNQKDFSQPAVNLAGPAPDGPAIASTQEDTTMIVQEHEAIRLSRVEQVAFSTALLAAPEPAPRLQKAVRSYRQRAAKR